MADQPETQDQPGTEAPASLSAEEQWAIKQAEIELSRQAAVQAVAHWENEVIHQMMELSTYMAHFYSQMETRVDVEVALRQSLWLMDKYISWHGGHSFFKKMPNIIEALTKVRVGSNLEDDDVPES